jgi:hypothetical protein
MEEDLHNSRQEVIDSTECKQEYSWTQQANAGH